MAGKKGSTHLTQAQKEFIVRRYALGDSTAVICQAFERIFGRELSRQSCWTWDPRSFERRPGMDKRLIKLYEKVQSDFAAAVDPVAIAQKVVRLRGIERDIGRLESQLTRLEGQDKVNVPLMLQIQDRLMGLREQAAKEAGGAYTNKHLIEHDYRKLTDDELLSQVLADPLISEAARALRGVEASPGDQAA